MKRSEMIKKVYEKIFYQDFVFHSDFSEYDLDSILTEFENLGMLPPCNSCETLRYPHKKGTYFRADYKNVELELGKEFTNVDLWEKEDE